MKLNELSENDRRYLNELLRVLEPAPIKLVQMRLPAVSPYSEITGGVEIALTGLRSLLRREV